MNIPLRVKNLASRHQSRDPLRIAKELNILVKFGDIGETKGFFTICNRNKVIMINSKLDYTSQLVVAAHELGHALLHSSNKHYLKYDKGISFIQDYTLFPTNSIEELQANKFAAELLIHDDYCLDGVDFTQGDQKTYKTLIYLKNTRL